MRRLFLLVGVVPLLTGCFYLPIFDSSSSSASGETSSAQSNVRNSVPAIEAWYADHGTYAGMTLALIQHRYDASVKEVTLVRPLNRKTYCVESMVGRTSYFKAGPAADILEGHCGDRVAQAPPPLQAPTYDAATNVRAAIPAIEAWNADRGTYAGMTVKKLRSRYDAGIPETVTIVRATRTTYCVESTAKGETYSFRGPHGPLAPGGC
ncbi:MAG TPA: hypothetical protein VN960_04025 [Gaiellaceae bacterium]|nr:hypothetical protein [Gaiellaceae bacterium]